MLTLFREQPRAFYMVFMLEIWERFGYYTVQGILTLYFIRFLGFDERQAYYTFGAFFAIVYGFVVFGGYLGDRVLGTKRTILLGLWVLAAGYLSLALANRETVFIALALICVGNGLFKANPSSLLARCYTVEKDARLHSGFTLYYMAVNLGSIFSLLLGPFLSSRYGYQYAYFASFLGILLALTNYYFQRHSINEINNEADLAHKTWFQWLGLLAGVALATSCATFLLKHVELTQYLFWILTGVITLIYFSLIRSENKPTALRMLVAFILMVEAIIFFVLYQQMPTSLNLFAVNNVRSTLFGIVIDPQSFQVLNPIWIVTLSPILACLYNRLGQQKKDVSVPYKFALGMFFSAFSFGLLYFARYVHDDLGKVSGWWLVASYCFQSIGELLVSALGVAMVAELVPVAMSGFVMGMWFLMTSLAGFLGASVAALAAVPSTAIGLDSLMVYTQVFAEIGLATLLVALIMWGLAPWLNRMIK